VRRLSIVFVLAALLVLSPAAAGAKRVKITLEAAPWAVAGKNVRITGTVTPHSRAVALTLEQRQGTGWKPAGQRAAAPDGRFTFVAQPSKLGLATYRVVTLDRSSASEPVHVRVLHWSYVDDIDEFAYLRPIVGDLAMGAADASGVHFGHSIAMDAGCYNGYGGSAWVDYPLERRYEMFTATVGLGGSATNNSTATYAVLGGDGKQFASGSLVFGGPPQQIKANVAGEYRLRIRINVPDPTNAGGCSTSYTQVIFGDAQLLGP
jgi:hypothetical protein